MFELYPPGMSAPAQSGYPAGKVYESPAAALFDLRDGATIAVGGFGLIGNPEALITAIGLPETSYTVLIRRPKPSIVANGRFMMSQT